MAIGIVGLLALLFVVALVYQTAREDEANKSAVPTEEVQKTPEEELFPPTAPDDGTRAAPKPEKKPPLNER